MPASSKNRRWHFAGLTLGLILALCAEAAADGDTRDVTARLLYESAEGWFIDKGRGDGLEAGLPGRLRRNGEDIGGATVLRVARSTAQIELDDPDREPAPQVGDEIVFQVAVPTEEKPSEEGSPDEQPGETIQGEEAFRPLLAPGPDDRPNTIVHGRLRYGMSWIHDQERGRDSILHRFGTTGSAERLFGESWSFQWDVDFLYRDGDGYRNHPDQRDVEVRPDLFVFRRHFKDDSSIGFGRLAPLALPSIGPMDGVDGEWVIEENWRVGAIVGFRPDPDDLGLSAQEPTIAAYSALEAETAAGDLILTNGALASWFEGKADRQALLNDLRLSIAPGTSFFLSSEVDGYTGRDDFRSGLSLTRLTARASVRLTDVFSVRGGWHQYQIPETLSRRSIIGDRDRYDWGHRRMDFGVREDLGEGWSFEQEIAETRASGTGTDLRWTVRGRKSRLPLGGSIDLGYSSLQGFGNEGYSINGGLSAQPLPEIWTRLGVFHQSIEIDDSTAPRFDTTQLTFDVDAQIADDWTASLQLARSFGESAEATTLFFSLMWRF
ncbi:MAG: hypothetical protein RL885_09485 [Planctomycetota bacterium]